VKANLLFFDKRPAEQEESLWVYDLRTGKHFTLRQRPIQRSDFDEFVKLYSDGTNATRMREKKLTADSDRWRAFPYKSLFERDKVNLDISWLREEVVSASEAWLASPSEIADSISADLCSALERFDAVARRL
jgi:type I restriction enzyme M protein